MAPLDTLRKYANDAAGRAYATYSGAPDGAVLLLADGSWVAGSRVENAAYPLTIPAATAALFIARAAGLAADIRALVSSAPFEAGETGWLAAAAADALAPQGLSLTPQAPDVLTVAGALPQPSTERSMALDAPVPATDADGLALATAAAGRAHTPASSFPVGCVVLAADGRLYAGANVEASDWTRGLCAERVALATMIAAGGGPTARRIWLSCPRSATGCSPCGACRQVLLELAPTAHVVMGRSDAPYVVPVPALLPGAFDAGSLRG